MFSHVKSDFNLRSLKLKVLGPSQDFSPAFFKMLLSTELLKDALVAELEDTEAPEMVFVLASSRIVIT